VKLIRELDSLPDELRRGALTIGNFDGVHLGHAQIIRQMVARARELSGPAIVFTFDPHPALLLRPKQPPLPVCRTERKVELLGRLGVDAVIVYPTDLEFLRLSAEDFFNQIVKGRLGTRAMVEGGNFFFGHKRQGNVDLLREFCQASDMTLEVVEPVQVDGLIASSSLVRRLLSAGQIEEANKILTAPYRIRGKVVWGAGRGRQLGFPTANLEQVETLLPIEGIYAGRAEIDGQSWPAAVSLGPNPTFDETGLKLELHLIGYSGSLYDQHIELDFLARLRDVIRFDSVKELLEQMAQDVAKTKEIVGSGPMEAKNEA
jgi:riboflavin kinase / FMN adenylyltransferase